MSSFMYIKALLAREMTKDQELDPPHFKFLGYVATAELLVCCLLLVGSPFSIKDAPFHSLRAGQLLINEF